MLSFMILYSIDEKSNKNPPKIAWYKKQQQKNNKNRLMNEV